MKILGVQLVFQMRVTSEVINLLDVARDEWDIAEIGSSTRISIGKIFADVDEALDRNLPFTMRVAKGM